MSKKQLKIKYGKPEVFASFGEFLPIDGKLAIVDGKCQVGIGEKVLVDAMYLLDRVPTDDLQEYTNNSCPLIFLFKI